MNKMPKTTKVRCLIKLLTFLFILPATSVYAYIDPGTTGMIISGGIWPFILAALAAVAAFFVKFFWKPIKKIVTSLWKK